MVWLNENIPHLSSAPLPPSTSKSARTLRTQRITGQIHPLLPSKIYRPDAHVTDDFLSTKRDKRLMKHSSFLSRIATTAPTSSTGSRSKITKSSSRRRPKNKLKTSLEGLADALPEIQDGEGARSDLEGKIRHRSLSSKKGALRRKEKLVRGEMKRFGASMAVLAAGAKDEHGRADGEDDASMRGVQEQVSGDAQTVSAAQGPTSNRWAALRGYISSTMEQNPAFLDK
ncbi:hypothetical protein E4U40_001475 [Claviceps sp. LM458 group G5]|nr:hypothetical protein E4U40_001475 [Claviceps sp. LM458 group G5]